MDALTLMERLRMSSVVQAEIPMQMQMGFPWLEKRNGRLCICFKPHREACVRGSIAFYAHQFEIAWVYPFEHLASFRNLTLDRTIDASAPVAQISEKLMLMHGYSMNELYEACTRLLDAMERDGAVSDEAIERYQRQYSDTVGLMGLSGVYAE